MLVVAEHKPANISVNWSSNRKEGSSELPKQIFTTELYYYNRRLTSMTGPKHKEIKDGDHGGLMLASFMPEHGHRC